MAFSVGRPCRSSRCIGITKTKNPYCPDCDKRNKERQAKKANSAMFNNDKYANKTNTSSNNGAEQNSMGFSSAMVGAKEAGTYKRPSAYRRGYDAKWQKLSKWFLQQNPWCVLCGNPADHTDHIIPLSKGGGNELTNLQSLCHSCHSKKTVKEF